MATPNKRPGMEADGQLAEAVQRSQWLEVIRLLRTSHCSQENRHLAIQETAKHAPERFVDDILDVCVEEELDGVVSHLCLRRMWRCVHRVLQRDIGEQLRREIVTEAMKCACVYGDFLYYVIPHCSNEELEQGLVHLTSQGQWMLVGKVLDRGVGSEQHKQAVEKALTHADNEDLVDHMLRHCWDQDLDQALTRLVSRRLWKSVDKVLKRGVDMTQRKWAVEEAMKHAGDYSLTEYIVPHALKEELEEWLPRVVSRGLWRSVGKVLHHGISPHLHRWAVERAIHHADDSDMDFFILRLCNLDDMVAMFPFLVTSRKWKCTNHVLTEMAYDTLYTWLTSASDSRRQDTLMWNLIHHCSIELPLALDLIKTVTMYPPYTSYKRFLLTLFVSIRVACKKELCEVLVQSLLLVMCHMMLSETREYADYTEDTHQSVCLIYSHISACIKANAGSIKGKTLTGFRNKPRWVTEFSEVADAHKMKPFFLLHFLQGLNLYHIDRQGKEDDDFLVVIFSVLPLFPLLQGVALKQMLKTKRWDVISQACLSHVWEHDRRQLFKAAVEQGQWKVVRQWADHTVHDDQRDWAMKDALKAKQWKAYLLLADHGLTLREQMHAHYMVAKYGNWNTVLQMVERGGDITEVSNLLETWVTGNLRKKPHGDVTPYFERCKKLIRLKLRFIRNSTLSPTKVLKNCMWGSVWFSILHEPMEEYFSQVMHKVIEEQEWHILMHLVRLGMNRSERDWLFPQMVRQQQWGVCRKLLEIGVDVQLCLEALQELIEKNQWTLVARVMEYDVDDAVRREVMQCAFQRREGVLFWHCLTTMKNKEPLPIETQRKLFHQALSREIWQAVKPLMVENDAPRIQHRDMAFLEAIEQHLWDVVDYCQIYNADINMEDENGETPLHREARKCQWQAVEEIVFRDGKPNLLDKDGVSVLNRLIYHGQREREQTVIKYGGNIHLPAKCSEHWYIEDAVQTPLQALIEHRHADVIHFTIKWCPEQRKGVTERGETALHAACDSIWWHVMEDLLIRQVDPLAVTKTGQSALVYAVLNSHCPQRMVAECCRLGFSMHQTAITGPQDSVLDDIISTVTSQWGTPIRFSYSSMHEGGITSPFVCAILADLPAVALMLYESGASSSTELFTLHTQLPKLIGLSTVEGRKLHEEGSRQWLGIDFRHYYSRIKQTVEKYTAFLKKVVTIPRSLQSSCRLLISRLLHFSDKKRLQHVDQLPLPMSLKNYVLFADLVDPDYGRDVA